MTDLKLVIGEQNRSAWSGAWLLLKQLGLEPLRRSSAVRTRSSRFLRYSPSGKLPILIADSVKVWDAMAIAETLGEHFTDVWPASAEARAVARSICAEVHGGFRDQQVFCRWTSPTLPRRRRLLAPVAADVCCIVDIWSTCRSRYGAGGPFLFGEFTIPDAMFAPICAAFTTHSIALDDLARAYVGHMMELPAMLSNGPMRPVASRRTADPCRDVGGTRRIPPGVPRPGRRHRRAARRSHRPCRPCRR